jgi:hypothetical protein
MNIWREPAGTVRFRKVMVKRQPSLLTMSMIAVMTSTMCVVIHSTRLRGSRPTCCRQGMTLKDLQQALADLTVRLRIPEAKACGQAKSSSSRGMDLRRACETCVVGMVMWRQRNRRACSSHMQLKGMMLVTEHVLRYTG